jgi:transaldolase/glucose-6-phosphate isomerase
MTGRLSVSGFSIPDALRGGVDVAIERALAEDWVERVWNRDATLWSADEPVQAKILNRLGWLHAPEAFLEDVEELRAFADGIREQGFTQVVLCGMGGSSLAPDVLAATYGVAPGTGTPVHVLDSTDPDALRWARESFDPATTLYVIATKSGTTTETLSYLASLWDQESHGHDIPWPALHFAAITDPGRSMESIPHHNEFREIFLNPTDVGGRYSALTYVGCVPAALLGIDLARLLEQGVRMAQRCRADGPDNPGLVLGATIGALAKAGRDKLTFLADPAVAPFGAWAEQLIAESTGKHGVGIVPVDREPPGAAEVYGSDRAFVRLVLAGSAGWRDATDPLVDALISAGHPVLEIEVDPDLGLGAEFFRWEFATAIAGAVLGINPFDEPNVTESKDNTKRVLADYREKDALPEMQPIASEGMLTLVGDAALRLSADDGTVQGELRRHLERAKPSGYMAIQAYMAPSPERTEALQSIRALLRDRTGRATTLGYGPRFLHSTGQLHKGGAPIGWFLQLVARHPRDLPVPGAGYTFGTLIDAQAIGDFEALEAHDLPVLRVDCSDDPASGLAALRAALDKALA